MLRRTRWLLVLLLVLGLVASPATLVAASSDISAFSPPTPGLVASPARTNGDIVVWSEEPIVGVINADVFGANLSDGKIFTIASGAENQINPRIDGNVVIWTVFASNCPPCDELHARHLGGPEFTVATPGTSLSFTDISGSWVVWAVGNMVKARDIATMDDPLTVATAPDGWGLGPVAITGNRVVWVEQTAKPDKTYPWQIRTTTIGDSTTQVFASGSSLLGGSVALASGAGTLVYTVGGVSDPLYGELKAISLTTFITTKIADHAAYPTTDGRYVVWQTQTAIDSPPRLKGYDLESDSLFDVPATALSNGLPDLANGAFVWESSSQPNFMVASTVDVETAWLWEILPSGRRPNPATTNPNWNYYPETGHYLSFGFKYFWNRSGGLPVFGYPLTEEFSESNRDLGTKLTVQYLERQRFEYHPELAGTSYETSLGRLGAEDAARRDLLGQPPFQPLSAGTRSDVNCVFFAVTGHRACFGFKDYWRSDGVELGDPGISYRESLALFGYPLSEEFVDPETGFVTQYFERAVFEYHPNNPDQYKVLLKRLGVDVISQRGW